MKKLSIALLSLILVSACQSSAPKVESRSTDNMARDEFRHPYETLSFFDIKPGLTVVEIWPGGGWYSEILAPMLKDQGTFYAAHFNPDSKVKFFRNMRAKFENKVQNKPEVYSETILTSFEPPAVVGIAPEGTADRVLTFRNVHNWMRNDSEQAAFDAFFKALKPGGILGVVEHRAPESFNLQQMVDSGYVSEGYVKKLAQRAGFEFVASSEINANAKDNKNHPNGVWSLPPTLRGDEADQDKYVAIGESDRMTLKFRKK